MSPVGTTRAIDGSELGILESTASQHAFALTVAASAAVVLLVAVRRSTDRASGRRLPDPIVLAVLTATAIWAGVGVETVGATVSLRWFVVTAVLIGAASAVLLPRPVVAPVVALVVLPQAAGILAGCAAPGDWTVVEGLLWAVLVPVVTLVPFIAGFVLVLPIVWYRYRRRMAARTDLPAATAR